MSPLRCSHVASQFKEIPHVVSLILFLMSLGSMSHVILRNAHVAVSNLGVEGHNDKRGPAFPFDIYVVHNVIDGVPS